MAVLARDLVHTAIARRQGIREILTVDSRWSACGCTIIEGGERVAPAVRGRGMPCTARHVIHAAERDEPLKRPPNEHWRISMMTRTIDPVVSTEWLDDQLGSEGLVILDIRQPESYEVAHIPGALSVPFGLLSAWADSGDLMLELPETAGLLKTIGDCGISADSRVVVVGPPPEPGVPPYALADPFRVAATLIYAGVKNAAVLTGGFAKWDSEGRATTTAVPVVTPVVYDSPVDSETWVLTQYVEERLGKVVLLDGRDPDDYFGAAVDSFADMRGHIPTARCLPIIWTWEADGTLRPLEVIGEMVVGVVGQDKEQEIICYCGAGGYASTWWFLLTQELGYTNVKIYDGSMEAWADEGKPIVAYTWTE